MRFSRHEAEHRGPGSRRPAGNAKLILGQLILLVGSVWAIGWSMLVTYELVTTRWTAVAVEIETLQVDHWTSRGSKGSPRHHYGIRAAYAWDCDGQRRRESGIGLDGAETWGRDEAEARIVEIRARRPPVAWMAEGPPRRVFLDPRVTVWMLLALAGGLAGVVGLWLIEGADRLMPRLEPDGTAHPFSKVVLATNSLGISWAWFSDGSGLAMIMLFLLVLHALWVVVLIPELVTATPSRAEVDLFLRPPAARTSQLLYPRHAAPGAPVNAPRASGPPPGLIEIDPLPDAPATKCPFCADPLLGRSLARCRRCQTLHHLDCWNAGDLCTTYACNGAEYDRVVVRSKGAVRPDD